MGIFFLICGLYSVFVSYQAIRYRRLYWYYPSISGFKERKKEDRPRVVSRLMGIYGLLIAAILFFFAYKCFE
jgi:hypothetical protein